MSTLALPSFGVRGFRAFRDLRIERLARVNLIVGKNNVGKTSLLEAVQLYAARGYPPVLWQQLAGRDEGRTRVEALRASDPAELLNALRYLFHGMPDVAQRHVTEIAVGPIDLRSQTLRMTQVLRITIEQVPRFTDPDQLPSTQQMIGGVSERLPSLGVRWGEQHTQYYTLDDQFGLRFGKRPVAQVNHVAIALGGLNNGRLGELWDAVSLTAHERDVIAALQVIAPAVEALAFVADPSGLKQRVPMVRISGAAQPIPLRGLGDGMVRMLGITLALANAQDGIVLIDEVENGLHYQLLPQLWRLVVETAQRLSIQVFATTHSWECIAAFQQVAAENSEEGQLIRLEVRGDDVVAVLLDEEELGIATSGHIEVR